MNDRRKITFIVRLLFTVFAAAAAFAMPSASRAQTACTADVDRDGVVSSGDVAVVLGAWGACAGCAEDLNADTVVDAADLSAIWANWGLVCAPVAWASVIEHLPDPEVVTDQALRDAIVATGYPWRVRDNISGIELLLIPPGNFSMGCSPSDVEPCESIESPVHPVTLTRAFYIGRFEVTQAEWAATMGTNPSYFQSPSSQVPEHLVSSRPVESVSWDAVEGFLSATGLRLPTEAEWEYAYRAGTTTAYHSMPGFTDGTSDPEQVWDIAWYFSGYCSPSPQCGPRPVGRKAPNGYGLYDMSGNVDEWVSDRYAGNYYASSPTTDPTGPSTGSSRVVRGGSWLSTPQYCRSSSRSSQQPAAASSSLGFRVARMLDTTPTLAVVSPNAGPLAGGTPITIRGANLIGASSVTVGGATATSFHVVNPTTVTAVTPAGTEGAADISIATPFGVATLGGGFLYQAPAIIAVSPAAGWITGGTEITITGTTLLDASSVMVGGVPATSVRAVDATTVTAVTPVGVVGMTSISVTTPSGTANLDSGFTYYAHEVLEQYPDPAVVTSEVLRNAIIATGHPWRVRDIGSDIEMLLIPPGSFAMGCSMGQTDPCAQPEYPVHQVTLTNAFYIGRYEVTQAEWTATMGANPAWFQPPQIATAQMNRPVEKVSWNTAQGFLFATGLRLPTEAEWEYAYRAGTTTAYHAMPGYPDGTAQGVLAVNIGWHSENNGALGTPTYGTKVVGQKAANGYGLYDMAGNVSEWVSDRYGGYSSSAQTNPTGSASGNVRVVRNGSWFDGATRLRASFREAKSPDISNNLIGFRVARAAE